MTTGIEHVKDYRWFGSRFDSNSNRSRLFDLRFDSNGNFPFAGPCIVVHPMGAEFMDGKTTWGWRCASPMVCVTQSGKEISTHEADRSSTPWGNRVDLAFCQPHGSYVTYTPWGRVPQKCASRYVHPMGPALEKVSTPWTLALENVSTPWVLAVNVLRGYGAVGGGENGPSSLL